MLTSIWRLWDEDVCSFRLLAFAVVAASILMPLTLYALRNAAMRQVSRDVEVSLYGYKVGKADGGELVKAYVRMKYLKEHDSFAWWTLSAADVKSYERAEAVVEKMMEGRK